MLRRHRRFFAVAAFGLLATPLVVGLIKPDSPAEILKEGRRLAPPPKVPATGKDWLKAPQEADAYLKDHFGLRRVMIRTHKDLTKPLLGFGNDTVLVGREGRLFYLGDNAVEQSAGLLVRDRRVADTVALLARANAVLSARGARLLVAVPPNAATTYQDFLPRWAQNDGRRTEYDLLLQGLAARGIRAVDLRPPVAAARAEGETFYMRGSHWTFRGALAGFNAIVEADGRPDWRLDPASALAPATAPSEGGDGRTLGIEDANDLARMLGIEVDASEPIERLTLPSPEVELLSRDPVISYVATTGHAGPTILVVGDSFTRAYIAPMLAPHAGRIVWLHVRLCRFDWALVDRFRPDEVWWMPTERGSLCDPGATPANFPG